MRQAGIEPLEISRGLIGQIKRRHIDEDVTVFQDLRTLLGDAFQRRTGFPQPGRDLHAKHRRRFIGARLVPLFCVSQEKLDMRLQLTERVVPIEPFDCVRALSVFILFVEHLRALIHSRLGDPRRQSFFNIS